MGAGGRAARNEDVSGDVCDLPIVSSRSYVSRLTQAVPLILTVHLQPQQSPTNTRWLVSSVSLLHLLDAAPVFPLQAVLISSDKSSPWQRSSHQAPFSAEQPSEVVKSVLAGADPIDAFAHEGWSTVIT